MTKKLLVACLLCTAVATVTTRPSLAEAPAASAEDLFQQARALVDAGNYEAACPKLEQSLALEPAVGTQFNLADCYEHVGRIASAHALFMQVAGIARAAGKFERERSAKARAAALEPQLPRVRLVVGAAAPGLEVRIDDRLVERAAWGNEQPIDPGPHRASASAPGRTPWQAPVTAERGKLVEVTVPELVDPNPREAPTAAPAPRSVQKTLALVTGGVGLAGLAVSAVAGAMALSQRSSAEAACPADVYRFRCPTEAGADAWSSASTDGNVATVAFVVGSVGLAGAAVLWFTAPSPRTRVGTTPTGLRLEGSF